MHSESQPNQQSVDPSTWPAILSIPLREYLNKGERPFIRLWAMCDLTEVIFRLSAIVGLAEIRGLKGELPATLRATTWNIIQRPTFVNWQGIVKAIFENLPTNNVIRSDFQSIFNDSEFGLIALLDDPKEKRTPDNSLRQLRNQLLAHGSGVNRILFEEYLRIWEPRFEKSLKNCTQFLSKWNFFCSLKDKKEFKELCDPKKFHPLQLSEETIEKVKNKLSDKDTEGDAIVLVRGETVRQLWPLALYGPPLSESGEDNSNLSPTPQIYGRHDTFLEYTPIGSEDLWRSVGSDSARDQFKKLLEPVRTKSEYKVRDFEKDLQDDARMFVGRKEQLQSIHELLSDKNHGVLWMTGRPGIGKSFLTAHVALNPFPIPKPSETHEQHADRLSKLLVLAYRFKVGDDRCSSSVFFQFALERLKLWQGLKDADAQKKDLNKMVSPEVEFRETLNHINNEAGYSVLLILDGCDELLQVERHKHFFTKGPIDCGEIPGVVWFCSGRSEDALMRVFSSPICTSVFPYDQNDSGVPPMDLSDIRQILLNQLTGPLRKRLLSRDQESNDTQKVENDFISQVAANSEGLPLYVRFVIGDIARKGTITNFDPKQLPESLKDFYQNLINQAGIGVLQQFTSPIIALLALAKEPLDIDIILVFLQERTLLTGDKNKDRKNVNQAMVAIVSLLQTKSTFENGEGYALNHQTLREYLKRPEMECLIAPARNSLNESCAKLELLKSAARNYLVRQSTKHLLEGECWDKLYSLFTNLIFLEAKNEAGLLSELNKDIRDAVSKWPTNRSNRFEEKHVLELLHKELIRNEHFINRHSNSEDYPQGLFQCLWNNLSSICSADKFGIDVTSSNLPKPTNPPVHSVPAGLKTMLDEWYTIQKKRNTPWFRVSGFKDTPPGWVMREHTDLICTADAWENPENPSELWLVSGGKDCNVILWNPNTGEVKENLSHENVVLHVAFLNDGRIVSGDADGAIFIWNPNSLDENPSELFRFGNDETISSLAVLSNQGFIVGGSNGSLMVYDLKLENISKTTKYHDGKIIYLKILANDLMVSCSSEGEIKLWKSNEESEDIFNCEKEVTCLEIQPLTNNIVVGCIDGTLIIIDLSLKEPETTIYFDEHIKCISFIKGVNSKIMVSFEKNESTNDEDKDKTFVIILDLVTKKSYSIFGYYLSISSIISLPNSNFLLLGDMDSFLITLNPKNLKKPKIQLKKLTYQQKGLFFKEKYLILWGQEDNTFSMHLVSDILSEKLNDITDGISGFKLIPDGKILEATFYGKVTIIDPHTMERKVIFDYSNKQNLILNGFSQLKNGKFVFFGSDIIIWDQKKNNLKSIKPFKKEINCLTELDNGEVVLGFENGSIEFLNLNKNKKKMLQNKGHKGSVEKILTFSNNKIVSSCLEDGKVVLWDLKTNTYKTLFKSDYGLIHINKLSETKLLTWESHKDDTDGFTEDLESNYEIKIWDTDTGHLKENIIQDAEISFLNVLPNEIILFGRTDNKLLLIKNHNEYYLDIDSVALKAISLDNGMVLIAFSNHEIQLVSFSETDFHVVALYYPISKVKYMVSTKESSQFWIINNHDEIITFQLEGLTESGIM